jgi:plastocyanin
VPTGSSVRWVNGGDVFHTVTSTRSPQPRRPSGLFNHALARRGARFQFTFTRPGVYHYYCQPHSGFMSGTVRVTG